MLLAHQTGKPAIIAAVAPSVVIGDFLFTATAVTAQPLTGALLAWNMGFSLKESWIAAECYRRVGFRRVRGGCSDDDRLAGRRGLRQYYFENEV
jgi:hypothetical protein